MSDHKVLRAIERLETEIRHRRDQQADWQNRLDRVEAALADGLDYVDELSMPELKMRRDRHRRTADQYDLILSTMKQMAAIAERGLVREFSSTGVCRDCQGYASDGSEIVHSPDCPVQLCQAIESAIKEG